MRAASRVCITICDYLFQCPLQPPLIAQAHERFRVRMVEYDQAMRPIVMQVIGLRGALLQAII